MKAKEIIYEVNWNKIKQGATKAANFALRVANARMGVPDREGFSLDSQSKKVQQQGLRMVKQTAMLINRGWKDNAQRYRNQDNTNLQAMTLVDDLNGMIKGIFGINPEDPSIRTLIKEISLLTRDEIKNDETQFDNNIKIQTRMLKLVNQCIELEKEAVLDDEPDIIRANFVRINIMDSRGNPMEAFYFSFKGQINQFFRYDIIPDSNPTRLTKLASVTDANTKRKIKQENPTPILIKDVSADGEEPKSMIEIADGTI